MKRKSALLAAVVGILALWQAAPPVGAQAQQAPTIKIPEPGVPQIMTIEGLFVRASYNNEGYVILGYKTANIAVGEEWMLLEIGTTVRDKTPNYTLKRDAIALETPDGKKLPLPSVEEYRTANLTALNNRANVARDSINYFPPMATQACRIGFFSELSGPALPWDEVELSNTRACLGRLYFKIPGGIKYGRHWLDVKFADSLVRVPFLIMTKEEEKVASKNYKDIRKQVQAAFAPPKKKK